MENESVIIVQHHFRCQYGDQQDTAKTIRDWLNSEKMFKGKLPGDQELLNLLLICVFGSLKSFWLKSS